MNHSISIKVVNAFAAEPFGGNPSGVVLEANELSEAHMLKIARQLNLVQTVFVMRASNDEADIRLRFFSPQQEIPIAGHPTVAAWHALIEEGIFEVTDSASFRQETSQGTRAVHISRADDKVFIRMDQAEPDFVWTPLFASDIAPIFGIPAKSFSETRIAGVNTGIGHLVFGVNDLKTLQQIECRPKKLRKLLDRFKLREAQIFTFETIDPNAQLHTRNISPTPGGEDPASGVGNGALLAYLMNQSIEGFDGETASLCAEQGYSVGMPSLIRVWGSRKDDSIQVQIGGSALTMMEGTLLL